MNAKESLDEYAKGFKPESKGRDLCHLIAKAVNDKASLSSDQEETVRTTITLGAHELSAVFRTNGVKVGDIQRFVMQVATYINTCR